MLFAVGAIASAMLVASCGSEPEPDAEALAQAKAPKTEVLAFANVFDCRTAADKPAATMTRAECSLADAGANARFKDEAPRFAVRRDCEAQFGAGKCKQNLRFGAAHFSPIMAGFMVGKAANGQQRFVPLFKRAKGKTFVTGSGEKLAYLGKSRQYKVSLVTLDPAVSAPAVKPATKLAAATPIEPKKPESWFVEGKGNNTKKKTKGK